VRWPRSSSIGAMVRSVMQRWRESPVDGQPATLVSRSQPTMLFAATSYGPPAGAV
jgi:hypothetical protein